MVAQQPSACAQAMRGPVWRVALRTCILSLSLNHLRGIHAEAIRGVAAPARVLSARSKARAVLAAHFSQLSLERTQSTLAIRGLITLSRETGPACSAGANGAHL